MADGRSFAIQFFDIDTLGFALHFLRTDPAANGRQGVIFLQHFGCAKNIACFYVFYEFGDVGAHGTTVHASGCHTIQATAGLLQCQFQSQSLVYLDMAFVSHQWIFLDHVDFWNQGAILAFYFFAQLVTPFGFTFVFIKFFV
jgi:hypothetical protein